MMKNVTAMIKKKKFDKCNADGGMRRDLDLILLCLDSNLFTYLMS